VQHRYQASPSWLKPVLFVFFLAILGGSYYTYAQYALSQNAGNAAVSADAVLRLKPEMRETAMRLNSDPCNRTLSFKLVGGLLQDADYTSVIRLGQSLRAKCGPNKDLLGSIYTAQYLMADYKNAEITADDMVAEYPASYLSYGWRSAVREKNGNIQGAYEDMRLSLGLTADPKHVAYQMYYDAARLADSTGNPCEAVAIIRDYVAIDAVERQTTQIATLTSDWQKKGACPPLVGTGTAILHYDTHAGGIILPVEINGITVKMAVDTGATRTVLTEELADRLGIAHSDQKGANVMTANGPIWVATGRASYISLGGARLGNVPVFVQKSSLGKDIDGLLGLSFLGNFQVRISNGILELKQNG
jgi:clan AA aspartic protease (TIGR02281 family)